jgi:glycosyltransferase involved in cell wall biosynthesis
MKIHYVNGSDIEGGASRAATRLLQGVHEHGIETQMHVQRKFGDNPLVTGPKTIIGKALGFARPTIEQLLFGITPGRVKGPFSAAFLPDGLLARVAKFAPDIVHLHWIARMMRLETLRHFKSPIVWTMHDSWAFTGGCYLPGDCTRYRGSCGHCPVLKSTQVDDLSNQIMRRKQKAWDNLELTIIAPSRWMAACAHTSSLFCNSRIEVIPNGLDVNCFKPYDRRMARDVLSLPQEKKLILFGAKGATSDRNKGFHLFAEALRALAARSTLCDSAELLIFGSTEPDPPPDLGFKTHYLGWQNNDTMLATLYAAADVFVMPSLHESLGYTVMEAMACGTPCVAFNQGGVPDLIDHQQNGYLAKPYETDDLAYAISWVLEDYERRNKLAERAREKIIEQFAFEKIADRHMSLYRDILKG